MRELIFKIIDKFSEGVDTYHNSGSMWLIFTDEKKWVIELTKEGTLWYNFYFFQDCFKYVSLDVVENQHYITEWVESIIQNGVMSTANPKNKTTAAVESIIQNGIKKTQYLTDNIDVEKAVKNGIIQTKYCELHSLMRADHIIRDGIKETKSVHIHNGESIESVIQNGIKETKRLKDENRPQIGNIIKQTNWRKVEHFPDYTDRITK